MSDDPNHAELGFYPLFLFTFFCISDPPGEPRIVGDTKQAFRQGEMINITCISSGGNPPPYVSWFKDNIQLQYPHTKLENGSTVSHLFIRADQTLLTDVYNCKAWNKETSIALPSKNVKFNVTCKLSKSQLNHNLT